jgi:signal transduction histidine kinase
VSEGRVGPLDRDNLRSSRSRAVFLSQLPLTGATAICALGIALFDEKLLKSSSLVFGIVVIFALTAVTLVVPWEKIAFRWIIVIPVLDIFAIGFMRVASDSVRLSILLVLPVIWLASSFRMFGAVVGFVLSTLAAWGPSVMNVTSLTFSDASRIFLLPLVLAFVGASVAAMSQRSAAHRAMLARQGSLVEEALGNAKQSRRVLDGILNAIDFGIIGLYADGRQTLINRQTLALLSTTADVEAPQLYGADRTTPIAADSTPIARATRGETFRRSLMWRGEPGTEQTALSVSAQQLADETGTRTGAVLVFQDVTAEVEALRGREELVAAVSHELRTPLTSIVGYLDLVEDDPTLSDDGKAYVRVAAQNADRLLQIISDLLIAASSAEGKLSIVPRWTDLTEIVDASIEAIAPRAAEREITVSSTVHDVQKVYVDALRMRQVLDNVLSNAVKYGKRGGTVRIDFQSTDADLRLHVADDGIGMSASDQEKLFDRFYRASAVRESNIHGTGLGLSISRAIMQGHGGDIRVSSELGVGTTLAIIIPR